MKLVTHNRRLAAILFLEAVFVLAASPANAQSTSSAPDQQRQPGAAYQDGFEHGKADAQASLPSYGQPGDQWSTAETRSAYSLGYGEGYAQGTSNVGYFGEDRYTTAISSQDRMGDAVRFGYADGRVAGRRDLDAGSAFRPADGEMYKNGDRGWNTSVGDKDRYRQLYREAYLRGYQEGYGNSPTTY